MRAPLPLLDIAGVPPLLIQALNDRFRAMTTAASVAATTAAATAVPVPTTPIVIGDIVTIDDVPVTY
jgi:hypothetical protein